MSEKKSVLWIFSNWILCTIHPTLQNILQKSRKVEVSAKCSITLVLISFTCILYVKTYRTLSKQAKMMADRLASSCTKGQTFSKQAGRTSGTKSSFEIRKARDQKFLTTIIIIACVALVTVLPNVIHTQTRPEAQLVMENSQDRLVQSILLTIMCVNSAANPFIYYLRLERYRKS